MKGHIRERSPGRWAIIIDDASSGERKRRWHSFAGNKRQAQTECARLINEAQTGNAVAPNRITVAVFLEQWLTHIESQVTRKTFERYRGIVRVNINPALGTIGLAKLQPMAISRAYAEALGRLAPRTVHHTHRVLAQAMKQAVRWRMLPRSPVEDVDAPRVERREMKVWDVATTHGQGAGAAVARARADADGCLVRVA